MTPEQLAKSGSEHAHQRALFARIAEYTNQNRLADAPHSYIWQNLQLLFAIPNGGDRHKAVAAKMKAEGAKSGVWDLFLPVSQFDMVFNNFGGVSGKHFHGLFIEMKEPGRRNHANGGLSDPQIEFGKAMDAQGYGIAVCYTWGEAFEVLLKYLGGEHDNSQARKAFL